MKRAMTLIELLIVMAILCLLAAILFPVYQQVKRRASGVQCISNLHQLGMALQMYEDDNDGRFPIGAYNSRSPAPVPVWDRTCQDLILPYIEQRAAILACPVAPASTDYRYCYGCSPFLSPYYGSVAAAQVDTKINGGERVYWGDHQTGDWPIEPWGLRPDPERQAWVPDPQQLYLTARHQGRVNVVYVDGHAKSETPDALRFGTGRWYP